MGKTKQVQSLILEELGQSFKRKSNLKKAIKAKDPTLEKYVKKGLKRLIKKGVVEEDGRILRISSVQEEGSSSLQTRPVLPQPDLDTLPIAAKLRKAQEENLLPKKMVSFADDHVDLDDEIKRLEAELNESSSGSSEDESTADREEDEEEDDEQQPAILSLSVFANDRIEQLPEAHLPEPGRYKVQGPSMKNKSRIKTGTQESSAVQEKVDGLKEAVKEVLCGYKARSSERLPFYCRFCSKQYNDENEFFQHKGSDFHKMAVDMERKATYCRLCRKQLTSPEQMKEHLKSKPHHEQLQRAKSRQGRQFAGDKIKGNGARQWT